MTTLPLGYDEAPPLARRTLVAGVLGAHLLGAWALLQVDAVRQAVGEVAPLMVELIAPPAPPAPPPPPTPSPPPPKVAKPPPPQVIAAAPTPAAPAPTFLAPPAPPEPPPAVMEAAAPPAPPAPPVPAPPPPPRTIPATAVEYLDPPAPVYPAASRRLSETGRVLVRVEIDTQGRARQVLLARSSGSPRLDEAGLAAVRAARFKPYTENGQPLAVWTAVPIVFELEN
jgi:protein TonB